MKSKIIKNPNEKTLKFNSTQISPIKTNCDQLKEISKNDKNSNKKHINLNKKSSENSIRVKKSKKNNYKKDINVITEYDNSLRNIKKKININYINDINEISIEGIKNNKESKSKNKSKEREKQISNLSDSIESNIIKKKYSKIKIHINNNLNETENKKIKIHDKEKEKEKEKEEKKLSLIEKIEMDENKKDEDPQLGKEYINDIIESLLLEEDYYLNKKKYIDPHYLENEDLELTPEMRTVAVDWLVLIHHKIFKFKENTLFLTIQIFDRYLTKNDLSIEQTELLLLTSFMLASKHNEIDYVNMQETLQLAQNKFTKEQVIEMEYDILNRLNFEILSPTMVEYFKLFASFLNLSEDKINHGFYVLNIVLVDFHMLEYPNFLLALAVVKLITKKFNKKLINLIINILEKNKMEKFLDIINGDIHEEVLDICNRIKLLYTTFLETKYKNIQDKFAENKYNCVSSYSSI